MSQCTTISTNFEADWSHFVDEARNNKRLQQLKCFVDDLRCRADLILNTKEDLDSYLSKHYSTLTISHTAKYLGSKFLFSNHISPNDCDENILFEYTFRLDDQYRNYLSSAVRPKNNSWDQWRRSQARRFRNEDKSTRASKITYIAFAVELTNGCSGGCRFCGFSAPQLNQNITEYDQNHRMYRTFLEEIAAITGNEYGKTGVLYWATDPLDHPQYHFYARDFAEVFGMYPHTTTAIAENKIPLIKEIINEHTNFSNRPWGIRCSLRSSKAYEKLRNHLSITERSIIQMNPQYSGKQVSYARSGRAFQQSTKSDQMLHGGTIACMTGFLFSLPKNHIQMITPCLADNFNINGYRTLNNTILKSSTEIRDTLITALKITDQPIVNDNTLIKFNADYHLLRHYKTEEGLSIPKNLSTLRFPIKLLFNVFEGYSKRESIENMLFQMLRDGVALVES
jgi:hypothetical protein